MLRHGGQVTFPVLAVAPGAQAVKAKGFAPDRGRLAWATVELATVVVAPAPQTAVEPDAACVVAPPSTAARPSWREAPEAPVLRTPNRRLTGALVSPPP
jgi:hypothetical protein